ncbi:hypothetical protein KM043_015299 [Ampulex compressa]|nr:hypothetical protein KM043_015299 [Ampulex compressa]
MGLKRPRQSQGSRVPWRGKPIPFCSSIVLVFLVDLLKLFCKRENRWCMKSRKGIVHRINGYLVWWQFSSGSNTRHVPGFRRRRTTFESAHRLDISIARDSYLVHRAACRKQVGAAFSRYEPFQTSSRPFIEHLNPPQNSTREPSKVSSSNRDSRFLEDRAAISEPRNFEHRSLRNIHGNNVPYRTMQSATKCEKTEHPMPEGPRPPLPPRYPPCRGATRDLGAEDELAKLEAALRRAYIAKELEAQLAEREANLCAEKARSRRAAEELRLREQLVLEDELNREIEARRSREKYGKQLEQQVARKREERRATAEEARIERLVLEEVDEQREREERLRSRRRRTRLIEDTRRERLILREIREIRKEEEEEEEEMKFLRDEEYALEIDARATREELVRREQMERRDRTVERVASLIANAEIEKREREALLLELVTEEIGYELLMREEEERERRRRMRVELASGLKEQMVFTEECKLRFVEQDRAFAEEVARRIMEDERIARLTAQARRRLCLRHQEDLRRLIEERRRIREREIARIEEAAREERAREIRRLKLMEEERKRLLAEHAPSIAGFVNKSALSIEERRIVDRLTDVEGNVDA